MSQLQQQAGAQGSSGGSSRNVTKVSRFHPNRLGTEDSVNLSSSSDSTGSAARSKPSSPPSPQQQQQQQTASSSTPMLGPRSGGKGNAGDDSGSSGQRYSSTDSHNHSRDSYSSNDTAAAVSRGGGQQRRSATNSVATSTSSHVVERIDVPHIPVTPKKSLNALMLFALMFTNCIGAPYGFEEAVGAGGPLITIIFCLLVPWLWTLLTGLAAAELSTAVPSNASVLMWCNVSFHPIASFSVVLGTVLIIFVGNATYPTLAAQYVGNFLELAPWSTFLVKLIVVVLCTALNIVGIDAVGGVALLLSVITLLPFLMFSFKQLIVDHDWSWAAMGWVNPSINWTTFFPLVSWNYSNLENAGSVVEEMTNPRQTLPRALLPVLASTYVAYLIPILAGVSSYGADADWSQWTSGFWTQVAARIAGPWLGYMLLVTAIICSISYLLSGLACTSRTLAGIGAIRALPERASVLLAAYHQRTKTPVNAILLNAIVTLVLSSCFTFTNVVSLAQVVYCSRLLCIYVALIVLRVSHPTLERPYALPCRSTPVMIMCLVPAMAITAAVAIMSALQSMVVLITSCAFIVGVVALSTVYVKWFRPEGFAGVVVFEEVEVPDDDAEGAQDDDEAAERRWLGKEDADAEFTAQMSGDAATPDAKEPSAAVSLAESAYDRR